MGWFKQLQKGEWEQPSVIDDMVGYKRAWVQHRPGDTDWAGTGRYVDVVRCDPLGRPAGNPTDFPIYNKDLTDEQVLLAFVSALNTLTGCSLRWATEEGNS